MNSISRGKRGANRIYDLDPKNMRTHIVLARAYTFSKDSDAAEASLQQALTADSPSSEILVALEDFRVTIGEPDQADIPYKQALNIV